MRTGQRDVKTSGGYTLTAIVLHWATVALVASGIALGAYMVGLTLSPVKLRLFSYHKWAGVTVFLAALVRIAWRVLHPAPDMPLGMASWERLAAKAAHRALYALIVIVPISGWLMSSAHGFQTVYFGVLPLPDLLAKDKGLADGLELLHFVLNKTLIVIVLLHVAAALKHHFIDRDDVLRRMLRPGKTVMMLLAFIVLPVALEAAPVVRETSRIDFISTQMGSSIKGGFKRFDADVRFDQKDPKKSRAAITVYIDAIDAGADDATVEVKRRTWFDAANHPTARFVSTALKPLGGGRFEVAGDLTIKGITRAVIVPFIAKKERDTWAFEGKYVLKRLDFRIGEGAWADIDTVADEVEVSFKLYFKEEKKK